MRAVITLAVLAAAVQPVAAQPTPAQGATQRLRSLEHRVDVLKRDAAKLKRDTELLKARLLGATQQTSIAFRDRMGASFRLQQADFALDGTPVSPDGAQVYSGTLAPGAHTLGVKLVYRGNGYGVFDYWRKYRFTVSETLTFTVAEGGATHVVVEGYERGDTTTPMVDRPAARLTVETTR